jgi:CHAT domain-containing protein/tetratricopeptide (TPR) repeat protein
LIKKTGGILNGWVRAISAASLLIIAVVLRMPMDAAAAISNGIEHPPLSGLSFLQGAQQPVVLEPNKPVDREISAGQRHSYRVTLSEGQYVELKVKQQGVEVGISLKFPDGKTVSIFPPFGNSPEMTIPRVAESAGAYQFEVYAGSKASPGRYRIEIVQLHQATDDERALQQARTMLEEYSRLRISGKYAECRPLLVRAIEIRERVLGPDDLLVATPLSQLASIYDKAGDYVAAEPLHERALKIKEKVLGGDSPEVAYSLQGLGIHYQFKGDYRKSEEALKRALAILDKTGGSGSILYDSILASLGMVYYTLGDYANAEKCYAQEQAIEEKLLGPDHFHLAPLYSNRGLVASDAGDYAKAEVMFTRALALFEKAVGPDKADITPPLVDLARLYCTTGEYAKARDLLNRALTILEGTGSMSMTIAQDTLYELARVYALQGQEAEAVRFETRAAQLEQHYIGLNIIAGSERQRLAFLATLASHLSRNISMHTQFAPSDPAARDLAVASIIEYKGRVQDALSANLDSLRQRFSADDRKVLDELSDTNSKLANLLLGGPGKSPSAEDEEQVRALEGQREALETEISRRSGGFFEKSQPVSLAAVQQAIPDNAALIEFAVYEHYDPRAPETQKAFSQPYYVAYVIAPQGEPKWADLGNAADIDQSIDMWRRALRDPDSKDSDRLGRIVDEKIMEPLRPLLGGASQLLVAPDGELNLAPLEALLDRQGRYLIQAFSVTYLTSGRDLLRMQIGRSARSDPVLVANPTFGEPPNILAKSHAPPKPAGKRGRRASVTEAQSFSDLYFAPLTGTEQEARSIQSLFPEAKLLTRSMATKSALKQLTAPGILHIATHGFFLEAAKPPAVSSQTASGAIGETENPLLRSGLALAGANSRANGEGDGILTALEASGINLWGTWLVTLSACDTGLGEVRTGEGVYGLRRSFVLAGAESVVMSLWQVSDYVTRETMIDYYTGLKQGLGRGEALRQVKLAILKRKDRRHPFYWASFIQSGDWTSLPSLTAPK